MAIINWDTFKIKHQDSHKAFESLSYKLFCKKYNIQDGIARYKNQTGIETEPVSINGKSIGFQAKYFDYKISEKEIIESIQKAKNKNPQLSKIVLYIYPEFSESSKPSEKKAGCQKKIENTAEKLNITLEWQMPSHIEIQLSQSENINITKDYFGENNSEEIIEVLREIKETTSCNLDLTQQISHEQKEKEISEKNIIHDLRTASGDFNSVRSYFGDLQDSYIKRKEVDELISWIKSPSSKENSNIAILTGNAGMGKTVVMKEVLRNIEQAGIPVLALKADMKSLNIENPGKYILDTCNSLNSAFNTLLKTNPCVVMLIDQIDALSQSLSNDRGQIKAYLSLIDRFLSKDYRNVKIITSCRKFDLNYDPLLSRWKEKKIIELKELSISEVKQILSILTNKTIENQYSDTTLELLRTPQHLDIFCRIYRRSPQIHNYTTLQDLYSGLWNYYIYNPNLSSNIINVDGLEKFIFSIAEKIQKTETLTPCWPISSSDKKFIDYLLSEGLITHDGYKIRFFHQSFYDYVYARWYTLNNKSLYKILCKGHQGLFIRSTVKQVLCYIREYDTDNYKHQLQEIFFSGKIRFHIQLLTFQLLASLQNIFPFEKQMVLKLSEKSPELFYIFISQGVSVEWFDNLYIKLKNQLLEIKDEQVKENMSLIFLFAQNANKRQRIVFDTINQIKSSKIRLIAAEKALWFVNDFSPSYIVDWYHKVIKSNSKQQDISILKRAIESNPQLVCHEIKHILDTAIPYWEKSKECKEVDKYDFFDDLCKPLIKKSPRIIYPYIKETVFKLIKSTQYSLGEKYLTYNTAFYHYITQSKDYHVLIDWLIEILSKQSTNNLTFVCDEIDTFIKSNDTTLLSIAFQVMATQPSCFTIQFFNLLQNQELVDEIIGYGDQEYYFRELLCNSYDSFNPEQQIWLQNYVLNFSSSVDKISHKEHPRLYGVLYPHIGVHQQILVHTLPPHAINPKLKRKMQELDRRYGLNGCKNIKPDHHITMACICGGLVSKEQYLYFTPKQWYKSFIKCEDAEWRLKNNIHFDINVHMQMFKECVEQNPEKFYSFIKQIIIDEKIHLRYKISGLEGLISAKFQVFELTSIFSQIIGMKIPERLEYNLIKITGLFLSEPNIKTKNIINYLHNIAKRPYSSKYTLVEEDIEVGNNTINPVPLLNYGINSIQGHAIHELIKSCAVKKNRSYIYNLLIDLHRELCVELKLVVLSYIYSKEYYDKELFDKLFKTYLTDPISDIVIIRGDAINQYLHNEPSVVIPYIKSVMDHPRSQFHLGTLLFLGWGYGNQECKELLEHLLNQNIQTILSCLSIAAQTINNTKFTEKSLSILNRYSVNNRPEITSHFSHLFYEFESCNFLQIESILDNWSPQMTRNERHSILLYLEKCCVEYPEKCYKYLKSVIRMTGDIQYYDQHSELELLLAIYKYLKEDNQSNPILNEIMDTFDFMLKQKQNSYELNEVLKEVDRI